MDSEEDVIDLQLCSDKILVWKAEDVKTIREKHNIVGKLIGCLPRAPHQNLQLGLPLQLMSEEAAILIEYGVARIIRMKVATPTAEDVEKFEQDRLKNFKEQTDKESKKMEVLKRDRSSYGKKKKQLRKERARSRKILLGGNVDEVKMSTTETSTDTLTETTRMKVDATCTGSHLSKPATDQNIADLGSKDGDVINIIHPVETQTVDQPGEIGIVNRDISNDMLEDLGKRCKRTMDKSDTESTAKRQKMLARDKDDEKRVSDDLGSVSRIQNDNVHFQQQTEYQMDSYKTMAVQNEANYAKQTSIKDDEKTIDNVTNLDDQVAVRDAQCNMSSDATVMKDTGNERMVNEDEQSGKVSEKEDSSTNKEYQGCVIKLPTCSTKFSKLPVDEWNYPSSETEWLRLRVFKDFWEKGYYLTSGGKFGGDFLVYPGNPLLFHSSYIAICRPHTETFSARELIQFGRMASNVRKTVIICSLDTQDELVFTSVQWTGVS